MKILIVSWFFPPTNTIGALRVGAMARYLLSQGHDVRVVTARGLPVPSNLPLTIPDERVVHSRWVDVNAPPKAAARLRSWLRDALFRKPVPAASAAAPGQVSAPEASARKGRFAQAATALSRLYTEILNFPDYSIGWVPFALYHGRRLIARDRPDVIFATAPMFGALIAGHLLAKWHDIPWVVELRDRWSDDPYYPPAAWRSRLMRRLERRVLGGAQGIGTVSDPWAKAYLAKYAKPTLVMYNGYDPEEFPAPGAGSPETTKLRIVHTGHIYAGRRDPSALFAALGTMGAEAQDVALLFLGAKESDIRPLAEAHGVAHLLEPFRQVPHAEALAEQARADILLLMQWNNPKEQGNVPGKLFEYLAIRRPILGLGLEDGVPATILRERGAGVFINEPEAIAAQLRIWIAAKRTQGALAALPASVSEGFTRDRQFAKLPPFIEGILGGAAD